MNILGINGGPNSLSNSYINELIHGQYHDSSVALLQDGDLVFALEEERLTRIKHTNYFPKKAIAECLAQNKLTCNDIDYFAFAISKSSLEQIGARLIKNLIVSDASLLVLKDMFKKHTGLSLDTRKVKLYGHHYCHAVSAFFQSGFDDSLVVTLDGVGEGLSGSVYTGHKNKLILLREFPVEKSLGHFYLKVTEFLGMHIFDEYKVMGLAPYGNPEKYKETFSNFYRLLPDGNFEIYFDKLYLLNSICQPRKKEEEFNQFHKDIAACLQAILEIIVFHLLRSLQKETGQRKICLAGGVALNCKLTGELLYSGLFDDVFVFPAAGDNGLSTGAALACQLEKGYPMKNDILRSVSLGVGFDNTDIMKELDEWKHFVEYNKSEDITAETAGLIADGEVIGWFSGKEEYGPRALGNRSIVADPRPAENKDRINMIIKIREGFRPFAPAILEESVLEYFELPACGKTDFPFMTFTLNVKDQYKSSLGAVVHKDGTARVQTVSKNDNPNFWKLIRAFADRTGTPVLLNTSFNNNFEPIVHSPGDAIEFLLTCNINYIVINDYLVQKKEPGCETQVNVSLPEHILPSSFDDAEKGHFFLHNSYLKQDKEISEGLWKILTEKVPCNFSGDDLLVKEIRNCWRQRLVKVSPFQKSPVAIEW